MAVVGILVEEEGGDQHNSASDEADQTQNDGKDGLIIPFHSYFFHQGEECSIVAVVFLG